MNKTIFITRNIESEMMLWQQLKPRYTISGYTLLDFRPIPFELPRAYDWIFFYSKRGVEFFFNQVDLHQLKQKKVAAMGNGTRKEIEKKGISLDFIGNGHPKETANAFLDIVNGQRVLFARARNSKQSIQKLLSTKIKAIDMIVYDNLPKPNPPLKACDIAVLTSPMNAATFLENYPFPNLPLFLAIGSTTADYLNKEKIGKVVIAESPSVEGIIKTLNQL